MGTELTIKDKGMAWYWWLIIILIVVAIGGYVFSVLRNKQNIKLKEELIQIEINKIDSLKKHISNMESSDEVTKEEIEKKKEELVEIEKKLDAIDSSELSFEDALKILKNE